MLERISINAISIVIAVLLLLMIFHCFKLWHLLPYYDAAGCGLAHPGMGATPMAAASTTQDTDNTDISDMNPMQIIAV